MGDYIVTCDEETASWIGNDVDSMEPIVRCRDCKYAHPVFWPARDDVPDDWVDCIGPLVETWDYYDDEPKDNPVRPDGFCAWGERREDA